MCSRRSLRSPVFNVSQQFRGIGKTVKRCRPHRFKDCAIRAERLLIGTVEAAVSLAPDADEAGSAQDGQVLRHVPEGNVEVHGNLAGSLFMLPHESQDLAAPRLGDDLKRRDEAILVAVETGRQAGYDI